MKLIVYFGEWVLDVGVVCDVIDIVLFIGLEGGFFDDELVVVW